MKTTQYEEVKVLVTTSGAVLICKDYIEDGDTYKIEVAYEQMTRLPSPMYNLEISKKHILTTYKTILPMKFNETIETMEDALKNPDKFLKGINPKEPIQYTEV